MRAVRYTLAVILCIVGLLASRPVTTAPAPAPPVPRYQQFLSPASPLDIAAAKKVDRLAWTAFEEGRRNAYTAAGPAFVPVRLTSFLEDDGIDISAIQISDDGSTVTFVRGTAPNRDGWVANPSADPDGPDGQSGQCVRPADRPGGLSSSRAARTSWHLTAARSCS